MTWPSKGFPKDLQTTSGLAKPFEINQEDWIQQFSRSALPQHTRTPATLDDCHRHMIRHVLLNPKFVNMPLDQKLWYCDDRFRQIRHNYKYLYQIYLTPNAFSWVYFQVRLLLTRVAVSSLDRDVAVKFAVTEKYTLMQRLTGCFETLLPTMEGPWQDRFAPIVSLIVLHHGFKLALSEQAKCESCGTWCNAEQPGGPVYQLEHPSHAADLENAYKAVSPEAAKYRVVQNSLLLLHALHSGEWFRFVELIVSLNLTFAQKCYAFSVLTYVRFRAIADTFGRPKDGQKARLCDSVTVNWLTEKLLFASVQDCLAFLNDLGVIVVHQQPNQQQIYNNNNNDGAATDQQENGNSNNNPNNGVVYMQGCIPEEYGGGQLQQPSPKQMYDAIRSKKQPSGDRLNEFGVYLPHPDFFQFQKAFREFYDEQHGGGMSVGTTLDLMMLIMQPDGSEEQQQQNDDDVAVTSNKSDENPVTVADSIDSWLEKTYQEVDPSNSRNNYRENSWEVLSIKAPSMYVRDTKAATDEFDRMIERERLRLVGKRMVVLSQKLEKDFIKEAMIPLEELYTVELRALSSRESKERMELVEKRRQQKKLEQQQREEQERKRREDEAAQQKLKQQQEDEAEKNKKRHLQTESVATVAAGPSSTSSSTNPFTQTSKPTSFASFGNINSNNNKPTGDKTEQQQQQEKQKEATTTTSNKNPFANVPSSSSSLNPFSLKPTTTTTTSTAEPKKPDVSVSSTSTKENTRQQDESTKTSNKPHVTFLLPSTSSETEKSKSQQKQQEQSQTLSNNNNKPSTSTSAIVENKPLQYETEQNGTRSIIYPSSTPFPFIDRRGYSTWLPRIIDQLKKMWMENSSHTSIFFPEYTTTTQTTSSSSFSVRTRIETDQVRLNIVVITPSDVASSSSSSSSSSQQQKENNNQQEDSKRLSDNITSMFYEPESSDKQKNLLCDRTFANGDLISQKAEDYEEVCSSPTFGVSAFTLSWRNCLELTSSVKNGGGVLGVLVFPSSSSSSENNNKIEELLDDFFSGFLRQFSGGSAIRSFKDVLHLRGLVLMCDVYDNDEVELEKINSTLERKWNLFSQKFNESLELLLEVQLKKLENEQKTTKKTARRSRLEQDWEMSDMFWNFSSSNKLREDDDSSSSSITSSSTSTIIQMISDIRSFLQNNNNTNQNDHQFVSTPPPTIVIPGKEASVRSRLGTALSDSMEAVVREVRRR